MEQQNIKFRKTRELGEIISDSFLFLKQESQTIFRLLLVYVFPFILLYAFGQIYMQKNIIGQLDLTDQEALIQNIGAIFPSLFLFMLFQLFIQSLIIGTFYSYIEAYVKTGKGKFSFTDISALFFNNSLLALGANLLFTIVTFFGIIMCFLPGIFFANTFSLVFIIAIYEKKGIGDAFSRSWKLVTTQWWQTLLLNLLGILIIWIVSMLFSFPLMMAGFANTIGGDAISIHDYPTWYWVVTGISIVVTMALYVIPFTFQAFQYFNLEESENPTINLNRENV